MYLDETISKAKVATSEVVEGREAPEIPWDCHMDDDLLKMLIIKAKLFEEQIKYVISIHYNSMWQLRNALSAQGVVYSVHCPVIHEFV